MQGDFKLDYNKSRVRQRALGFVLFIKFRSITCRSSTWVQLILWYHSGVCASELLECVEEVSLLWARVCLAPLTRCLT